jgi:hypothetical protein
VSAGLGQQREAGVIEAVGQEKAGRPLGDQCFMPRPGTASDFAARGVEPQRGGAEVVECPGPFGFEQPLQV